MSVPTSAELALLRSQPHRTSLNLSIYKPKVVFQTQLWDGNASKGQRGWAYNDPVTGTALNVRQGMTMRVGTSLGDDDKGVIWILWASGTWAGGDAVMYVGENSHINWQNLDYLTVLDYYQIWPIYPRYVQSGENVTVYKAYDTPYTNQNEILGSLICMGPHHAGYLTGGSHQVYYTATGTKNMNGYAMTYDWAFEGGTPTGSTALTPGNVTYSTPGHYTTRLTVSTATGTVESSYRHISIYDRPEDGVNTPILSWGLISLSGSREEGGYTARAWVDSSVSDIEDGALCVIFADDWYGSTKQSIGGNAQNRQSIVFVGYIIGSSITYNYEDSRIEFDIGSPTEVMKQAEAFSISLEDSLDPVTDGADPDKGVDPWFYLVGLTVEKAIYHYLRWHSTLNLCADVQYIDTDYEIQYFDPDRTSLYDALSSFLRNAIYGSLVSDRQGKLWCEIDAAATDSAVSAFQTAIILDNHDWMGEVRITERHANDVSYLEAGGVAYAGLGDGGAYNPYLACAPGVTPTYRGTNQKISGLALESQDQLNTLVGNIYAFLNSRYPEVALRLTGNYRILDIAPQEIVKISMAASDNQRGISWTQKAFVISNIEWDYDGRLQTFLPSVTVAEITDGIVGDAIVIPVEPPDDGFEQPPATVPAYPMPTPIELPGGVFGWSFIMSGGGEAISTGIVGAIEVPFKCTITSVKLVASTAASIVVDLWRCSYGLIESGVHPVAGDSIVGSGAKPTLSSAVKSTTVLSGWTSLSLNAGDWLYVNVDSADATLATLAIMGTIRW